jgi:predicted nucleotidyltransferase
MRLSVQEQATIREEIAAVDPLARVLLFGSRARDTATGGDIDLLVVSPRFTLADELRAKVRILDRIGWQKLDLIVVRDLSSPLAADALAEGLPL